MQANKYTAKPNLLKQQTEATILTKQQQKDMEISNIQQALKYSNGKIYGDDGAASLLGLKPTTLASKIKKHGIDKSFSMTG